MYPKSMACLAFALVCPVLAQTSRADLSVTLQLQSQRFLVGEPILLRASISNVTDKTLYLAYGQHGFTSFPVIQSLSGNTEPFCPPQDMKKVEWGEGYEIKPLAPRAALERLETMCDFTRVFAKPGRYRILWRAESLGPYEKRVNKQVINTYPEAWAGMVDSAPVEIELIMPMGIDREVFEAVIKPAVQDITKVPGISLWMERVLEKYPTSTYAGYALAKKLTDLSDWRFKVATPASIVEQTRQNPGLARFSPEGVDLFNRVEKLVQSGNVAGSLKAELYGYYGEQLALRGRNAEAEAAFKEAVKTEPADPKGKAYYHRAEEFFKALAGEGTPASTPQK